MSGEHIKHRPNWDCTACGKPLPCNPAREEPAATLSPVALRTRMWARLERAALDMPHGPPGELFERFLHWTGS
jgi:hypothetical protein